MQEATKTDLDSTKDLQLEQLRLANEKLKLEVEALRQGRRSHDWLGQMIPLVTALVAAAGFLLGVAQYVKAQRDEQAKAQAAAARELMQPWLQAQRETYLQALSATATVAYSADPKDRMRSEAEFWRLYQGKMVLVETKPVSGAMKQFGACLNEGDFGTPPSCTRHEMGSLIRKLASAMEDSMSTTAKLTFEKFSANQFKYASTTNTAEVTTTSDQH